MHTVRELGPPRHIHSFKPTGHLNAPKKKPTRGKLNPPLKFRKETSPSVTTGSQCSGYPCWFRRPRATHCVSDSLALAASVGTGSFMHYSQFGPPQPHTLCPSCSFLHGHAEDSRPHYPGPLGDPAEEGWLPSLPAECHYGHKRLSTIVLSHCLFGGVVSEITLM